MFKGVYNTTLSDFSVSIFLPYSGKWKSAQKYINELFHWVTGSLGHWVTWQTGRGYFRVRTNSFPEWRENRRNRKSRNE